MPASITATAVFESPAPPAAVWKALTSPDRWPEVLPDLRQGLIEPPGRLEDGAIIRTFAMPGTRAVDMSYRVLVPQIGSRLALSAQHRVWRGQTEYLIEGSATRSRITLTSAIEPIGFWTRLAVRLWHKTYTQQLSTNIRTRTVRMLQLAEKIAHETEI